MWSTRLPSIPLLSGLVQERPDPLTRLGPQLGPRSARGSLQPKRSHFRHRNAPFCGSPRPSMTQHSASRLRSLLWTPPGQGQAPSPPPAAPVLEPCSAAAHPSALSSGVLARDRTPPQPGRQGLSSWLRLPARQRLGPGAPSRAGTGQRPGCGRLAPIRSASPARLWAPPGPGDAGFAHTP